MAEGLSGAAAMCYSGRAMRLLVQALALTAFAGVTVVPLGCGAFCRDIFTRELDGLACVDGPNRFTGELHFDSPETFETFVGQQCMPDLGDSDVRALVESVDWSTEAVFVAVGPANIDGTRCVAERTLDRAQVCTDGLKVYFRDIYVEPNPTCAEPRWTVAFVLLRSDLRAALEAGAAADGTN